MRRHHASEREVDRVSNDDQHDPEHQGHHEPDHYADCRKATGRYPPDSRNERCRSADVSGRYPIWMTERLKKCGAVAPGECEVQGSGQDRERRDGLMPFSTEQEVDELGGEDDAK